MAESEPISSKPALFSPVHNPQSALLSDLAAEQITSLIRSGQLSAGARMPAERVLARQLGVSRTALREALRILEATGVLEATVGRGRFVTRRPNDPRPMKAGGWLEVHRDEVAELNHVLQLVEPAGILEVPMHLLPETAVEARSILQRARMAVEGDDSAQAAELDGEFHRSLCRRTPNRLLRNLISGLIDSQTESARAVYEIPAAARNSLDQHLAIISALENGSRENASQLLREHAAVAYRFAAEQAFSRAADV